MFRNEPVAVVIVGAGTSTRMDGVDKIFAGLAGRPVLAHSVAAFELSPAVDHIVLVLSRDSVPAGETLARREKWQKISRIVAGGARRQDSVKAGLEGISGCGWVIVHDAARPLLNPEMIEHGLSAAAESGAAVAVVPVSDTIKESPDGVFVASTPARDTLWAAQTPQVFRFDILREAYRRDAVDATDDAALVEACGYRVRLFPGSYQNLKITNPIDLILAERLIGKGGHSQ